MVPVSVFYFLLNYLNNMGMVRGLFRGWEKLEIGAARRPSRGREESLRRA